MIRGKIIVCVSFPSWDGVYMKSTVQIMAELARYNRVLYVDYEYTVKDMLMTLMKKQQAPIKRMVGLNQRLRTVELENGGLINILTPPPVVPVNWINNRNLYLDMMKFNAGIVEKSIQKALQSLQFRSPIVINAFNPYYGLPMVGAFDESLLVYYCYDEIRAAKWCKKHGGKMEDAFIEKVDAVITTSHGLYKSRSGVHKHTFLVQNGVDFNLFNRAFQLKKNNGNFGTSHSKTGRNVVGYIGSIDNRLDFDLLQYCVFNSPDTDFWFVGHIANQAGKNRLAQHENVKFFGPKQAHELPDFLSKVHVGIIPFVKNRFTKNIYPLKINEYLAASLPVVLTDFSPLHEVEKLVYTVSNKHDFLTSLRKAMEPCDPVVVRERLLMAESNSWENRVEHLSVIFKLMLEQKANNGIDKYNNQTQRLESINKIKTSGV